MIYFSHYIRVYVLAVSFYYNSTILMASLAFFARKHALYLTKNSRGE